MATENNIIIYNTEDGKSSVALYAKDSTVWMNQQQLAELFDTSKPNISMHISSILKDKELEENSVVKNYFTTASDGKNYDVTFYSSGMMLAIGFRIRSRRGTQFRKWANQNLKEYMIKGFLMDDECLKNPDGRPDYFRTENHNDLCPVYFVLSTKVISPLEMAEAAFFVSVRMKISFSTCLL